MKRQSSLNIATLLICTAFFLSLSACATFPPPKLTDNHYENPECGFMIDLPGGDWVVSEKIPEWYKETKSGDYAQLMIFNNSITAGIAISCDKSSFNIFPSPGDSDFKAELRRQTKISVEEIMEKRFKKNEEDVKKGKRIISYNYGMNNFESRNNKMVWDLKIVGSTDLFKYTTVHKYYTYPYHDDTISTWVEFFYQQSSEPEAVKAWDTISASLKMGDGIF